MSESRYLRKGSMVAINISKEDRAVTPGMLEYNGELAAIARICKPKKGPAIYATEYGYELEGVVSPYGIPYTFTKDMII